MLASIYEYEQQMAAISGSVRAAKSTLQCLFLAKWA
jgi:hypothetical protein